VDAKGSTQKWASVSGMTTGAADTCRSLHSRTRTTLRTHARAQTHANKSNGARQQQAHRERTELGGVNSISGSGETVAARSQRSYWY
jgi:hypothetical protein